MSKSVVRMIKDKVSLKTIKIYLKIKFLYSMIEAKLIHFFLV